MESYSAEMPKNVLADFQEKAKFSFVWRITSVFTLAVYLMALYTYLMEDRFFLYYLTVGIITGVGLLLLHFFKKYKPVVQGLMESYSAEMPKNVLADFQEKAKFSFVWRITSVFTLAVYLMALYTYLMEDRFFLYYLTVGIITGVGLLLLHFFKKYKPVVQGLL